MSPIPLFSLDLAFDFLMVSAVTTIFSISLLVGTDDSSGIASSGTRSRTVRVGRASRRRARRRGARLCKAR